MTYEEWKAQNISVADKLQAIANRTVNMAWAGSAHPENPEFVELMDARSRLLNAADRLLQSYEEQREG